MSQFDPMDYFNAWKLESEIHYRAMKKTADIVGEYF